MSNRRRDYALGLLAAIDPVAFHRCYLTGILPELDAWQIEALRDPSPNKLLLCGRQTGKSTLAALMAAHTAVMLPARLVLLLSPTLRQSTELFRKTLALIDAIEDKPGYRQKTATQLALANQSKVVSLPGANPDAIRGFSKPDLIIEDEAAFVGDRTFTATRPMLAASTHPTHVLMSTPYGRRGHFHERWQANDPDWSRHTIKSEDCPRIAKAFLEGERRVLSERAYRQEYECEFLEATTSVFPYDLLERLVDQDDRRDHMPDDGKLRRPREDAAWMAVYEASNKPTKASERNDESGWMSLDKLAVDSERWATVGVDAPPEPQPQSTSQTVDGTPLLRTFCKLNNERSKLLRNDLAVTQSRSAHHRDRPPTRRTPSPPRLSTSLVQAGDVIENLALPLTDADIA